MSLVISLISLSRLSVTALIFSENSSADSIGFSWEAIEALALGKIAAKNNQRNNPNIREMADLFVKHDIILCRNVIIYFNNYQLDLILL